MLPRRHRVRRSTDFATAVRRGRRSGRPALVTHLLSAQPGDSGPVRAGFIVGKAVGSAVTRNVVRRRLRHLVAARLDQLPAGSTLVVRALPAASWCDSTALGNELDRALRRLLPERAAPLATGPRGTP